MKKLVKFEKDNCGPCQAVSHFLQENKVNFEAINPFDEPELAIKNKVRSLPTLILFDEDKELGRVIGYNQEAIRSLIANLAI